MQATRKCAQPRIRLEVARREHGVVLAVEDNGVGMTNDEMEHALDVFYSQRKGGTGLGLAIAARIAKNHGSELRFESTPEVGTRVEVELAPAWLPVDSKTARFTSAEPGSLAARATHSGV
jgi:signal transduction histidine kinase